jgi:hypothetical protein
MTEHQETKAGRILKEKEERGAAQEARTKVARGESVAEAKMTREALNKVVERIAKHPAPTTQQQAKLGLMRLYMRILLSGFREARCAKRREKIADEKS